LPFAICVLVRPKKVIVMDAALTAPLVAHCPAQLADHHSWAARVPTAAALPSVALRLKAL
jgi:hypothetical protein